jgi:hypothetical protein
VAAGFEQMAAWCFGLHVLFASRGWFGFLSHPAALPTLLLGRPLGVSYSSEALVGQGLRLYLFFLLKQLIVFS